MGAEKWLKKLTIEFEKSNLNKPSFAVDTLELGDNNYLALQLDSELSSILGFSTPGFPSNYTGAVRIQKDLNRAEIKKLSKDKFYIKLSLLDSSYYIIESEILYFDKKYLLYDGVGMFDAAFQLLNKPLEITSVYFVTNNLLKKYFLLVETNHTNAKGDLVINVDREGYTSANDDWLITVKNKPKNSIGAVYPIDEYVSKASHLSILLCECIKKFDGSLYSARNIVRDYVNIPMEFVKAVIDSNTGIENISAHPTLDPRIKLNTFPQIAFYNAQGAKKLVKGGVFYDEQGKAKKIKAVFAYDAQGNLKKVV